MSNQENIKVSNVEKTSLNKSTEQTTYDGDENDKKNESDNLVIKSLDTTSSIAYNNHRTVSVNFVHNFNDYKKRFWRIPWCFIVICVVQIICYYVANDCIYQRLIFIYKYRFEYWRYATYMLLHSDLTHLLLNVFLQLLIGFCLENEQGRWKVLLVFLSGGVSGSIATAIFQPHLSLLGASAGVYAMLMSHVPHLIKNFTRLPYRYLRIVSLCILFLSDVGFTAFHYIVNKNRSPRICLEAHLAGAVCGFLIGMLIFNELVDQNRAQNTIDNAC